MADNVTADAGSGGAVFATDDITSVHYPRVKVGWGPDGTYTEVRQLAANALPTQGIAAEDASVLGAPNLVGGRYDTVARTLDDGDVGSVAITAAGHLIEENSAAILADTTSIIADTTAILADTASIDTNVATVAGAVTGTEMQVDIVADGAGLATTAKQDTLQTAVDLIEGWGDFTTTAVELIDDAIVADDAAFTPATTKVMMSGFEFDDTTPDSVDEGDAGAARMSANRNIYTTLRDAAGNERGANVNASNQLEVNLGAQTADVTIADGGNAITVDWAGTAPPIGAGVEATALRVTLATDSTGVVSVDDNAGSLTVDNAHLTTLGGAVTGTEMQVDVVAALPAGTNAIGKLAANSGVDIGDVDVTTITGVTMSNAGMQITGDEAHDAVDAGNPVKIGARATNSIEGLTQVANADRTNVQADLNGVLITRPFTTPEEIKSERKSETGSAAVACTVFDNGGGDIHNYITTAAVYNSSSTDVYVDLMDGTGGSAIFTLPAPRTGGSIVTFPVPLKTAAATALAYKVSSAVSTIYISFVGYQAQG